MNTAVNKGLSVDTYVMFKEAKRIIKTEFNLSLSLRDEEWMEALDACATMSSNPRLKALQNQLRNSAAN